jgi:hypothetical protein
LLSFPQNPPTSGLVGSTPPPGTIKNPKNYAGFAAGSFLTAGIFFFAGPTVPNFVLTCEKTRLIASVCGSLFCLLSAFIPPQTNCLT